MMSETKFTATQQPGGGWYLHAYQYGVSDDTNRGFRGQTIDECLSQMYALDGERIVINIGYLKRKELKEREIEKPHDIPVPTETLNLLYEQTGGAFGSDPDAYGRAVEAEYQRLNTTPSATKPMSYVEFYIATHGHLPHEKCTCEPTPSDTCVCGHEHYDSTGTRCLVCKADGCDCTEYRGKS